MGPPEDLRLSEGIVTMAFIDFIDGCRAEADPDITGGSDRSVFPLPSVDPCART
jgi:hypothetical protein